MGRVCVSSSRCCVLVSVVHPAAILSVVFCVICSLLMFVSDASSDHMVDDITITSTHKYECSQEIHTTIPTYSFCLDKTKQPLTKYRQNNLHSVHTRPCRIYEQSGPNNKQQSTTYGNAPKGSGSYLSPKTRVQHTHPQHLSTSTQTSTNHKSTHCNRVG